MFTKAFWLSLTERAGKTFCQTLLGLLSTGTTVGLLNVNWGSALELAGVTTLLSILTSLASAPIGPFASASVVHGKHEAEER